MPVTRMATSFRGSRSRGVNHPNRGRDRGRIGHPENLMEGNWRLNNGYRQGSVPAIGETPCFLIHPWSPFGRLGITSYDVRIKEIGYYSVHGDLEDPTQLDLQSNRGALRAMAFRCEPDSPVTVRFHLDEGYKLPTCKWARYESEIPDLQRWLQSNANDPDVSRAWKASSIITSRKVLAELMKIVYKVDCRSAPGWLFGAAKVDGKVVIGKIADARCDNSIAMNPPHEIEPKWKEANKKSSYRGMRFEAFMTATESNSSSTGDVADGRFRSVMNVQLGDLTIILEGGVDGADPFSLHPFPQKYVDSTIVPAKYAADLTMLLHRERFLRWWVSDVFMGLEHVHVGIHEDGVVTEVQTYRVGDIPKIVRQKEVEIQRDLWNPDVCLGFLHQLLHFVLRMVERDHSEVVYEFYCPITGDGGFVCQEVLSSTATGHTYLPFQKKSVSEGI